MAELLLEQFKHYTSELKFSKRENCPFTGKAAQHKPGRSLSKEMKQLVEDLLTPNATSNGVPVYMELKKKS
jgi:DNA mismatch repair protein MutL